MLFIFRDFPQKTNSAHNEKKFSRVANKSKALLFRIRYVYVQWSLTVSIYKRLFQLYQK